MLNLNLLSQQKLAAYERKKLYSATKTMLEFLLFSIIIIGIIVVTAKAILQISFNSLIEETTLVTKNTTFFNQEIVELNQKIKEIKTAQNNYIFWNHYLLPIVNKIPAEVKISQLDLGQSDKKIVIKGVAQNREGLLGLKRDLESLDFVSELRSPIANILQSQNINFEFTLILNI